MEPANLLEVLNRNPPDSYTIYKHFGELQTDDAETRPIIRKIWELISKQLLVKDVIYLSALSKGNFDLVNLCLKYDKKTMCFTVENPQVLLDYTIHYKRHWLLKYFETVDQNAKVDCFKKSINAKINFLELIKSIQYSSKYNNVDLLILKAEAVDENEIDGFWYFCLKEIRCLLNLVKFCRAHYSASNSPTNSDYQMLLFSSDNSVLDTFSKFLHLPSSCNNCMEFFNKVLIFPHKEDFIEQKNTLTYYSILNKLFQLIIPDNDEIDNQSVINDKMYDIQKELLNIDNQSIQMELLEIIFASCFIKKSHIESEKIVDNFLCNPKRLKIILLILKSTMSEIKMENDLSLSNRFNVILVAVLDGLWRLDLIVQTKQKKSQSNLMYYMLADPRSLIYLSVKHEMFDKAYAIADIYKSSKLTTRAVIDNELYHELCGALKTAKTDKNLIQDSNQSLLSEIAEETFLQISVKTPDEYEELITVNIEKYPFLWLYKENFSMFLNVLDVAIVQTEDSKESKDLLRLAAKYTYEAFKQACGIESSLSKFYRNLIALFQEININDDRTISNILLNSHIPLDIDLYHDNLQLSSTLGQFYTDFCKTLANRDQDGTLNKNHLTHGILHDLNSCSIKYLEKNGCQQPINYLQKLYNYLEALSKIFYIEIDTTELITDGKDTSYFQLLFYNRSELMGILMFEKDLKCTEFEKHFNKLKLDFLYHVAGNCFPTINLHIDENVPEEELYHENRLFAPNKAVIMYILQRSWLLALILNEIYQVEGVDIDYSNETRLQIFINYLHLPRLSKLKIMFDNNDLIAALQNEINYKKLERFINREIVSIPSTNSTDENTSIWKSLVDLIDSIPELQLVKDTRLETLRDRLLVKLIENSTANCYMYTMRIKNRHLRVELLMKYIKIWPIDFCIKFIRNEVSRFDNVDDEITAELRDWLKHIEHVKMVMEVVRVETWIHFYDFCFFEPKEMIDRLLINENVNLLIDFLHLNESSPQMLACIDEHLIEKILVKEIDHAAVRNLLNTLPRDYALNLCEILLKNGQNLDRLVFVVDYIRLYKDDDIFTHIFISLKILLILRLNAQDRKKFLQLIKDPQSIIEVLIMNTKLEKLDIILEMLKNVNLPPTYENCVSAERIDELLRRYAEKSLEFTVQPNCSDTRSQSSDLNIVSQSVDTASLSSRSNWIVYENDSGKDQDRLSFVMPEEIPTKDEWIRNTGVSTCMCCNSVKFSMFNRRHHCRRCGRIVCATCSKNRMEVENYGRIQVRVCLDCYQQTFKDQRVPQDSSLADSYVVDEWMLTDDPEQNRIIRDEFTYELAPSVSLCLSLMKFHRKTTKYIKFLLQHCKNLLVILVPNTELDPGTDYLLVISMLKSLAMAAKMEIDNFGGEANETSVNEILNQIRLFELLTERGCLHLLSIHQGSVFVDSNIMRKLIDKLLTSEQWNLALEISTKAGLDNTMVFSAWANSCLKAGAFATAREKFKKCFTQPTHNGTTSATKIPLKEAPLLKEIIKTLEMSRDPINTDILRSIDAQKSSNSSSLHRNSNINILNLQATESPIFISNKLKNLKFLERGQFPSNNHRMEAEHRSLEPLIYDECVYYLDRYGNDADLIDFHLKYQQCRKILELILDKKLNTGIFVNVYMTCLKDGFIHNLQFHMSQIDSSLNIWKNYLKAICIHLEKQDHLHSLYQLQQYMGDYVRAALTCIRFYEKNVHSFTTLMKNKSFLVQCEEHLKQTLEQEQWVDVQPARGGKTSNVPLEVKSIINPFLTKKMTQREVIRNTHTINLQKELANFLAQYETVEGMPTPMQIYTDIWIHSHNADSDQSEIKIPTLFTSLEERRHLSVLCIVCGKHIEEEAFNYAFRLMKEFKLRYTNTFNEAGRYLARAKRFVSIMELVNLIRSKIPEMGAHCDNINEVCDEILTVAVVTLTKLEINQPELRDELLRMIFDKAVRVSAYIESGQLKAAYFLAAKYKRVSDIRRIMREAEMRNQQNIKIICQKAIQKYMVTSDDD